MCWWNWGKAASVSGPFLCCKQVKGAPLGRARDLRQRLVAVTGNRKNMIAALRGAEERSEKARGARSGPALARDGAASQTQRDYGDVGLERLLAPFSSLIDLYQLFGPAG